MEELKEKFGEVVNEASNCVVNSLDTTCLEKKHIESLKSEWYKYLHDKFWQFITDRASEVGVQPEVMPKIAGNLKKLMIILYNQGYAAGHEDTVESCYVDIKQVDMDSYHEDIVTELIEDDSNFTA